MCWLPKPVRRVRRNEPSDKPGAIHKQVDRLLSNPGLNVWDLFAHWVPHVLGASREIVVALDWTAFDADAHATIALHLVTRHGRSCRWCG